MNVPAPSFTSLSLPVSDTLSFTRMSFAGTSTRILPPPTESVMVVSAFSTDVIPATCRSCPCRSMIAPAGTTNVPSPRQSQFAVSVTIPENRIDAHVGISPAFSCMAVLPVTSITRAASPADSFATR